MVLLLPAGSPIFESKWLSKMLLTKEIKMCSKEKLDHVLLFSFMLFNLNLYRRIKFSIESNVQAKYLGNGKFQSMSIFYMLIFSQNLSIRFLSFFV